MKSRYWYLLVFLFPLSAAFGMLYGGVASYSTFILFSIILPLMEIGCGQDFIYPRAALSEKHTFYRLMLYGMAFAQLLITILGAYFVPQQHGWELFGTILAVGICGGITFAAAHELIHKNNLYDHIMANLVFVITATGHAPMEHVLVHHGPYITGTAKDHVHAREGMSFYQYYLPAMWGLRRSAWNAEKKLLQRQGRSCWNWHNRLITLNLASLMCALMLTYFWGFWALIYFLGTALVSSGVILAAAYVQHYGLERMISTNGQLEKFSAQHCWNSNYVLSNYLLFQLPRHSIHHLRPGRDYEYCEDETDNPQLPYGYFVCGLLILVPPLWFKLMAQPMEINKIKRRQEMKMHTSN